MLQSGEEDNATEWGGGYATEEIRIPIIATYTHHRNTFKCCVKYTPLRG